MIYFTSDLHFCHNKEFIYTSRGCTSIEEHDEKIIKNWNDTVSPNDSVFVLGDIMLKNNARGMECIDRLNGRVIYMIWGNHDSAERQEFIKKFASEHQKPIVNLGYAHMFKYENFKFFLSHYPTMTENHGDENKNIHRIILNLFGHTHQKERFYKDIPTMYNVGLDAHNCKPISIDEIIHDMVEERGM